MVEECGRVVGKWGARNGRLTQRKGRDAGRPGIVVGGNEIKGCGRRGGVGGETLPTGLFSFQTQIRRSAMRETTNSLSGSTVPAKPNCREGGGCKGGR